MFMKAIRLHEYGGPEVLRYEDAPVPDPQPGDVLVKVHGTSVNPIDWKIRQGYQRELLPYPLPMIPGWDVSGVVESAGSGSSRFRPGTAVFGRPDITRNGSYAQYITVRESELATKPTSIDHIVAGTVPLVGLTAWQTLFEAPAPASALNLKRGQRLLIHGAGGGVGTFAVQLAHWCGAHVIATASAKNVEFLRELGANEVVDYTVQRFEDVVGKVDAVLDLVGGETQTRSWSVLSPGGALVSVAAKPSEADAKAHGVRASYVTIEPNAAHLARLASLIDEGRLKPILAEVLPLAEMKRAHELSATGQVRGKLAIRVP